MEAHGQYHRGFTHTISTVREQYYGATSTTAIRLADYFWQIWKAQYLTGLREHHKLQVDNKRGTTMKPQEGEVVLLCDSLQPRNTWEIGRIVELRANAADTVREVLTLSHKTRLRRPVNRVVQLEKGSK
ncbi:hypothetical protein NECAME_11781 [Necator americanus]|uniref:DUF5641 domain-containing protein n=1 Tax=Necator americanus TaxID=51031 RepID=W2T2Q9_NECAM|nr:hypothetical protein NECAME_11781 [Necator americanus]ETN76275.1 hypothetical protein NECAME_11781 [Necator americanus]